MSRFFVQILLQCSKFIFPFARKVQRTNVQIDLASSSTPAAANRGATFAGIVEYLIAGRQIAKVLPYRHSVVGITPNYEERKRVQLLLAMADRREDVGT